MKKSLQKSNILFITMALLVCIMGSCNRRAPISPKTNSHVTGTGETTVEAESSGLQEYLMPQEAPKPVVDNLSIFNAKFLVEPITEMNLVLVEGGTMEIQGKEVRLDSFYMNKYALNYYIHAIAHNWAYDKGYPVMYDYRLDTSGGSSNILLEWNAAITICNYLSIMEGLSPVYLKKNRTEPILSNDDTIEIRSGPTGLSIRYHAFFIDWDADGYRLPTEAEWEYAARGGNKSKGYIYSGSNTLEEVLTYYHDYGLNTSYIPGQKKPNEIGIHDMSGQASEWCIGPWTEFGKMKPVHNPDRIVVFEFTRPFYLLQKGGCYGMGQDGYRPEGRIKFQPNDNQEDFDRSLISASVRLVRKAE